MVTFIIVWSVVVALLVALDLVSEVGRRIATVCKRVPTATLEQNVATADEYEIAYLKGGEYLPRMMALRHLVKSGYYDKGEERFTPNTEKDRSPLAEFEKAMLLLQVSAEYGEFIFSGDEAPVQTLIDKYAQRARHLDLFYKRPSTGGRIAILIVLVVLYISYWGALDGRAQLAIGGLIVVAMGLFLWRRRSNQPVSVVVTREGGNTPMWSPLSNHVLTRNGREYVALFEKMHYLIDDKLVEASGTCPCSLLD